jgi:trigger factor
MKFDFEVEVRPDFELPSLDGIAVDKPKIVIGDAEIDEQIETICKRSGIWEPKDGPVEDGDRVVANVVMDIEGAEEDDKRENIEITAEVNGFVAGVPVENLNEVLAGAKAGDEKKTKVDVPATFYNEQLRGKSVDITIDVKEVKALIPAELNEEFFTRVGLDDEADLRDKISEQLEQQADSQAKQQMAEQIHKYLRENTKLDLPESIVADQSTRILQRQYSNMLLQGMEREQMDQQMGQMRSASEDEARDQLMIFFIMDKVAEKLEVEVTDEEVNSRIAQIAAMRGRRPEKMREELARDGSLAQFSLEIREQKCIDKMLESAKITEVKAAEKAEKKSAKKAKKKTAEKPEKKAEKKPAAKAAKKKTAPKKPVRKKSKDESK